MDWQGYCSFFLSFLTSLVFKVRFRICGGAHGESTGRRNNPDGKLTAFLFRLSWSKNTTGGTRLVNLGFTLIELLIVVAIIGVLVAIAVPNFVAAQVRAKAARVTSDMRSLHTAVECYCVDNGTYPRRTSMMPAGGHWQTQLTTPVSYCKAFCTDIFCVDDTLANRHYQYAHCMGMRSYITVSVGPDTIDEFDEVTWKCPTWSFYPSPYDPTNGVTSRGDVWRLSKQGGPVQ